MRSNVEIVDGAILNRLTILEECPRELIVGKVAEEVFVVDANLTCLYVYSLSPNVLVNVSNLVGMRIELTVGTDDAIAVEVVVGRVVGVVVATIGILNLSELRVREIVMNRH